MLTVDCKDIFSARARRFRSRVCSVVTVNEEELKKAREKERELFKKQLKEKHKEDLLKARQIIGEKIRRYRDDFASLTQDELGELSGTHRTWINNMEMGHENYTIDELVIVLLKCGVSFKDFLQGEDVNNLPTEIRNYHDDLKTILSANSEEIETGIRVNLRAIRKEAVAYKKVHKKDRGKANARDHPTASKERRV